MEDRPAIDIHIRVPRTFLLLVAAFLVLGVVVPILLIRSGGVSSPGKVEPAQTVRAP